MNESGSPSIVHHVSSPSLFVNVPRNHVVSRDATGSLSGLPQDFLVIQSCMVTGLLSVGKSFDALVSSWPFGAGAGAGAGVGTGAWGFVFSQSRVFDALSDIVHVN